MRQFAQLSDREILALAITLEEEHARIYRDYVDGLKENYPASAQVFAEMADEEDDHRGQLFALYQERFGEHIPLLRPHDIGGFIRHEPLWMVRPLGLDAVRKQAEEIEYEARRLLRARHGAARTMRQRASCSATLPRRSAAMNRLAASPGQLHLTKSGAQRGGGDAAARSSCFRSCSRALPA